MLPLARSLSARLRTLLRVVLIATLISGPGAGTGSLIRDVGQLLANAVGRMPLASAAAVIAGAGIGAGLFTPEHASAQVPYDDEFNSSTLDPKWSWIREQPGYWSLTANPGYLRIITNNDDILGNINNAPVLLQPIQSSDLGSDFEISTKVTMTPTMNYQQAGLVIYGDDDNYVRLTFGYIGSEGVQMGNEIAQSFQSIQDTNLTGSTYYLKLVRHGTHYSGYFSTDGTTWKQVGEYSNNLTVSKVGLTAFNGQGTGATSINADFDYFHLQIDPPCTQLTSPNDEFNSSTLDSKWYWIREQPANWSLTANPDSLRMITANDDIWQQNNTAPVLLEAAPSGDFVISTKITMTPTMNYQQGGLVIYGDDDNYVRLTFGYFSSEGVEFGSEVNQSFTSTQVHNLTGSTYYLELNRVGNTFTGFYSADGNTWTQVAQYTNNFTVAEVGLSAFNSPGTGASPTNADFDYFHASVASCQPAPAGTEHNPPFVNSEGSGDPVSSLTGSYTYTKVDLAIAGRGPSPSFSRSYNSDDTRVTALGPGWTDNYAARLNDPGDGTGDLILVGPQGRSDRYRVNSDGSYTPPAGITTTLAKNADGSFTATFKDQNAWTFSSDGRLIAVADRYGNKSALTYNANNQLISVSDPAGRGSLALAYDPTTGLLTSVSDWLSPARSVQFGYDASGRLHTVTDRNGKITTYVYDGTTSHLTTITDARSHAAITNTYDPLTGKVTAQEDALGLTTGQQTTFSYVTNPDGTQTTTVTYPATSFDGTKPTVTDTYDTQGRLIKHVTQPSANSAENTTVAYTYDANSNPSTVIDARGNTTTFCYDVDYTGAAIAGSFGNLTRVIAPPPSTGQNPLVTLFKYDGKNNLLETIPPNGVANGATVTCTSNLSGSVNPNYATDNDYDQNGVYLLSTTRSYTDNSSTQSATTTFAYTDSANSGLVTKIIAPKGNTGTTSLLGDQTVEAASDSPTAGTAKAFSFTASASGSVNQLRVYLDASSAASQAVVGLYADNGANAPGTLLVQAVDALPRVGNWNSIAIPETSLTGGTKYWIAVLGPSGTGTPVFRDQASGGTSQTSGQTNLATLPSTWTSGASTANGAISAYAAAGDPAYATKLVYFGTSTPTETGMLESVTDPMNNLTTYTYDAVGRRTSMVDPNGNVSGGTPSAHTWNYTYDNEDRLLTVSAPAPASGGNPLVTQYQYDAVGNRTVVIDANGQVTQYQYDERDSLSEVDQSPNAWTDPKATPNPKYVTTYAYDNLGNLSQVTRAQGDPNGNERATAYTYDGLNRLRTETQYPQWPTTSPTLVTTYTYDGNGNRLTLKDPNGNTSNYGYDAENRLSSITYSDGKTPKVSYAYDANGNRSQMSDGTGSTAYSYDEMDRLTSVTSPGSQTVSYRYDLNGNRSQLTYPDQTSVTYGYDNADRLTSVTDWASHVTRYVYNADSTLKTTTNVDNSTAQYTYDNAQRITEVLNQSGSVGTEYLYSLDSVGNRLRVAELANGTGNVYAFGDNSHGQLGTGDTTSHPTPVLVNDTGTLSQIFARANQSFAIKPDGSVWGWGDNTNGQLGAATTQTCSGNPCSMSPIAVSGTSSVVSTATGVGGGHTLGLATGGTLYAWGNNTYGQLGDGTTTSRLGAELITGISDVAAIGAGEAHSLAATNDGILYAWGDNAYGQLGTTSSQTCSSTPCSESPLQVSGVSGVIAVVGGANHSVALTQGGNVYAWGANDKGQVGASNSTCNGIACQTTPAPVTGLSGMIAIASGDNFTLALKSDGTVWSWGDNSLGQLGIGSTNPTNGVVQVSGLSGIQSISAGSNHALAVKNDGTVWAWGSNADGQLGVTTSQTCGTPATACSQSPTQVTGLGTITEAAAGSNHSLTLVTPPGGTAAYQYDSLYRLTNVTAPGYSASYQYDPVGNRVSLKQHGKATTYTYDKADRLTSSGYVQDSNGNLTTDGGNTATYDQANRLTSITIGGTTTTYAYDGDGNRASKTVGTTTTSYVYDVNGSLPNVLTDGTLKYVYGLDLAYAVDGSGNLQIYHTDGLGSVRAITNGSGNVIASYKTDPFGAPLKTTGNSSQPFQFTGQQRDAESGLYDLRARMYDPSIGRFLTDDRWPGNVQDPVTLNGYTYASNNPVLFKDPSGLVTGSFCVGGEVGAVAWLGASACIAAASNGDLGWTFTVGGGGSSGAEAGVNVGVQGTNGNSIRDIKGQSTETGTSGRVGELGVAVEYTQGTGSQGQTVSGGSVSFSPGFDYTPPGEPVEVHWGVTDTAVSYFNLLDLLNTKLPLPPLHRPTLPRAK